MLYTGWELIALSKSNKDRNPPGDLSKTRWYEKHEALSLSVQMMESFPLVYQEFLGSGLTRLAEKHCQAEQALKKLRALSPEKVLSLFKAKSKARSYDKIESLHHAMNCLYVLPAEQQVFLANQTIEIIDFLIEYFAICQHTEQKVDDYIVRSIIERFVAGEFKNIEEHLTTFYPSMTLPNGPTMQSIRSELKLSKAKAYQAELRSWRNAKRPPGTPEEPEEPEFSDEESAAKKDETVTLGNRDMKIRLDKMDL